MIDRVSQRLFQHLEPRSKLVVALSGGIDSIVLLDVLDNLKRDLDFTLSALHVNHQLSPNADEWVEFCRAVCSSRGVPFEAVTIQVPRKGNQEATARALRYQVFSRQAADFVVLAQHQDDQVETFLLRLLRGAGVNGLAGMRMLRTGLRTEDSGLSKAGLRTQDSGLSGGGLRSLGPQHSVLSPCPRILRPLLGVPRAGILNYAIKRGLKWIEDESNRDTSFDRNFLRREILPAMEKRFPAYRETIARAADNLGDAAELLDELACIDAKHCITEEAIDIAELKRLSLGRAKNLLRFFLRERGLPMPDRAWLEQALRQILHSRTDAKTCIALGEFELRRYRQKIYLVRSFPERDADWSLAWRGESEIVIPELGGALRFVETSGMGISRSRLSAVMIRTRRGGERFRPDCNRPRRSLKNLLQEHGVPPWLRDNLPLLFDAETLVWAPGIGIACEYRAREDEMGIAPEWTNGNVRRF
ncbi:MAG: tRNA lysidine(34) synthetase TilS [Burkholderiales bacterium]